MPVFSNRIAFVVPTKDRPDDLRRMLTSLQVQSVHPDQVIVVDGSENPIKDTLKEFPKLNIQYSRVYPPSLSRQRNVGIAAIEPGVTLAGHLDDDLVFKPGAMEAMLSFWESAPDDVGGARFNIITDDLPRIIWIKSLFLLESRKRGKVLRSGYQTAIGRVKNNMHVRWLSGGVTVWRRQVIEEFSYDEWFEGTGYLEDVDYSYRVGEKYKLAVVADAHVEHLTYPVLRDKNYLLGKWQAINRTYFVKKHKNLSLPLCYWSMIGELLLNCFTAFWRRDVGRLRRALGNCVGLLMVTTGPIPKIDGFFK